MVSKNFCWSAPNVLNVAIVRIAFALIFASIFASGLVSGKAVAQTTQFDGKWLRRVPDEDRAKVNPLAHDASAAAQGKTLFAANCAHCHGADALGTPNRPSLRSPRVRHAKDGELGWMLRNGDPYAGMPPFAGMPEQQRWQIIAYMRTLPVAPAAGGGAQRSSPKSSTP